MSLRRGPDRVLIGADGTAVPPRRAREEYGIVPDVVFVRNDGWSLGAPIELRVAAYGLWEDEWITVIYLKGEGECDGIRY